MQMPHPQTCQFRARFVSCLGTLSAVHIETSSRDNLQNPVLVYQTQRTMGISKATEIEFVGCVAGV
jgi:hypothetical protein